MKKYFLIVQAICCIFLISCQNKIVLDDKIFTANEVAMICPVADFYLKGYLAEKQIEIEEEIVEIKFISGQNTGQSKPNLKVLIDDKEIATTKQVRHGLELNLQDIQLYESKTMQVIDINRPSCLIEKSIIRKCSPSKIYNQLQNKCNDCPERQSKMNDFECGCSDQYADINDYCWCSDPYIWQNGQCVACGDKQKKINNQTCACILEGAQFPICDCPGDLVEIDNRCDCPMGQIKIGNNCNCPGNQIKKGNECGCPGNQHEIVDNNCVCKIKGAIYPDCNMCMGDLTIINDKCDCPIGQVKSGNNCNCPGNQIKKGNECGCPGNQHEIVDNNCVCKIKGAIYPDCNMCMGDLTIINDKCDCPIGQVKSGNNCNCPGNQIKKGNECGCPGNQHEIVDNNCVCKIKGAIYPDCNMCMGDLTIINDKCDCPIGQVKSGNNCNCPGNQIKKGNECGCPGNDHKIAGGMCVCKIEGALYPACNLCLGDLIIVDNKCDCPSGHIREGNTCSCPDNKVFFDNKCDICKGIYDEIEKACKPCPSGTTYYEHPINECIQSCDEPDLNNSACLGFHDSFERINISGAPFNWTYKVEDNGASGDQCYFEIRNTTEMGYGLENGGNKIAVARGRTGGSTHEMYLISRSFDFSDWNKVLIKFYYFPINLDLSAIWFNNLGLYQHEHVRIDICKSSDDACGLTDFKVEKIRSRSSWQALWINEKQGPYTNTERGSGLDLVPGQTNLSPPWQIAEFTIDLSDPVFATRKNNFVFKITAAMDEGCRESLNCSKAVYSSVKKNTRYADDVILIDEVIVIGFK